MKAAGQHARTFWWLVQKDLLREVRAPLMWPSMGLVGLVLVLLLTMQTTVAIADGLQMVAGFLWLAIFFAGTIALERSFCGERDEGCWQALLMYPTSWCQRLLCCGTCHCSRGPVTLCWCLPWETSGLLRWARSSAP
jgi:ABC-type transport system involved in cytochrome c biogenesis permease component